MKSIFLHKNTLKRYDEFLFKGSCPKNKRMSLLSNQKKLLLMKIQNTNEYGIKIKYHKRYLMLILHTISQCIVCL
jgi:hypothetical protein